MGDDNLVTEPTGGEVSPETLTTGSIPQGGMPPKGTDDVESKLQAVTQKYERDIANLKSTLQRNEYELKQQLKQQKEAYDQFVRESKIRGMDENERKKFEEQELIERNKNYEAEAQAARQALAEREQKDQYRDFFMSQGIDPKELDNSGDLTVLVNSGYTAWAKKTKALEKQVQELIKKGSSTEEELEAPPVDTSKGSPPKKSSWADLIKVYGSAEAVYRLVERGKLPASILPE